MKRLPLCERDAWVRTFIQLHGKPRYYALENNKLLKFDAGQVGRWVEEMYLR